MANRLVPFSHDLETSLALARAAAIARADPGENVTDVVRFVEGQIRSGSARGGLWMVDGRSVGVAVWDPPEPLGIAVRLSYLVPLSATPAAYRELLAAIDRAAGPVAFAAPLPGLSLGDEAEVLRSLGFAPFHRTEMRLPSSVPIPKFEVPAGVTVRLVRPGDRDFIARVHAAAFGGRFDRYLFLEDLDPARDAARVVSSLWDGRWGEFLSGVSFVAESAGTPVGSTLVIRSEGRALIADVAVDPAFQHRGVGRSLMIATIRALRLQRERVIALAVTEENRPAFRLYERLGFVRAVGPDRRWYSTRIVPVAPGTD